jgi:DNA-directed RNA polymerase subunit omega
MARGGGATSSVADRPRFAAPRRRCATAAPLRNGSVIFILFGPIPESETTWRVSPSKTALTRSPTALAWCCYPRTGRGPFRQILVDRDNDKNPVVALREVADDVVDPEELKETLIGTLQRVDEHSEAEEEAETLALLADPTHMQMSEQELVRALQSDRDGGQEERY